MNIYIPKDVEYIINTFYENGYESFMVGGCVRDSLLKKTPTDYDITTSAPPDITQKLFNKTIPTGIQHGTITIIINNNSYEVTTYRTEGTYIDNRRPDSVSFVTDIKEDLSRRDFTINAFAYNDKEGLKDYFNGINDLNNKVIKCVGNPDIRFNEDSLRMLRAIRFSSQLNFDIEDKTYNSIVKNYELINNISVERITTEFSKTLLSNNPYKGLSILNNINILSIIIPNLDCTLNNRINTTPKDLSVRLSYIFINSDINLAFKVLKKLKLDNKTIDKTILLLEGYNLISSCSSKASCKRILSKVSRANIYNLISLYEIYNKTKLNEIRNYVEIIISNNEAISIKDLNINGSILKSNFNFESGKEIGLTLNHLLDLVIEEKINNKINELLIEAKKYILEKGYLN